jgi:hypothetical protein
MTNLCPQLRLASTTLGVATILCGAFSVVPAAAQTPPDELVAHRAVYELKLANTRGKSAVSARGRILYDFTGSACEGYKLDFRQVSELDNGEGKQTLSDLRSTTWEDGAAKNYKFNSQNYLNQRLIDTVDGTAERQSGWIAVTLTKPKDKGSPSTPPSSSRPSSAPHDHRRRARRQDHSRIPRLRRLGNRPEGLQYADGHRP